MMIEMLLNVPSGLSQKTTSRRKLYLSVPAEEGRTRFHSPSPSKVTKQSSSIQQCVQEGLSNN